jgi:uncharacterized protein (DUF2236 family)
MVWQIEVPGLAEARRRAGAGLFSRVAGPSGADDRNRIHLTPGPRWFDPERPIRRVHSDASMFVGGLRALLLQSLHPLAMAAVAAHSGYRSDPWGRLQRTSLFLATTTFGTTEDAERIVARVRGVHRRVSGIAADGRAYRASDPHLVRWVHVAEVDSFLRCHQRYGARPLDDAGCDGYVADAARVATALGVPDPPTTRAELAGTPEAREAARFLLIHPPLPLLARPPYAVLAATAVASLPGWARWPLRLPYLPVAEHTAVRLAGHGLVAGIRWAMTPPERAAS